MLGGILRSVRGIELDDDELLKEMIASVVRGQGHFLGETDTLNRMKRDFYYPEVADRSSPEEWEKSGSRDIRWRAREQDVVARARMVSRIIELRGSHK